MSAWSLRSTLRMYGMTRTSGHLLSPETLNADELSPPDARMPAVFYDGSSPSNTGSGRQSSPRHENGSFRDDSIQSERSVHQFPADDSRLSKRFERCLDRSVSESGYETFGTFPNRTRLRCCNAHHDRARRSPWVGKQVSFRAAGRCRFERRSESRQWLGNGGFQ